MKEPGGKVRIGEACECLARALARALGWSLSASRAMVRPGLLVAMLIVLAPVCVVLTQSRLHASVGTIYVNTTEDPGSAAPACALRDAITAANTKTTVNGCVGSSNTNTINFEVSGTITLASALPPIANSSPRSLTIDGTGQTIAIDGYDTYQILYVNSGATLTLNDLTIEKGYSSITDVGGGIGNEGTLTVTNSTFFGNIATDGGGIFNNAAATLTVTNSTFSENTATDYGGGIYNVGAGGLTVTNSTFSDNGATISGGGIFNEHTLNVTNSTFSDNSAPQGGGIYNNDSGTLTVTNSTFSDNSAGNGGGIYNGGIYDDGGTATVTNSILAMSPSGGN